MVLCLNYGTDSLGSWKHRSKCTGLCESLHLREKCFDHMVFRSHTTCQPNKVDGQQVCLSAGFIVMEEYVCEGTLSRAGSKFQVLCFIKRGNCQHLINSGRGSKFWEVKEYPNLDFEVLNILNEINVFFDGK